MDNQAQKKWYFKTWSLIVSFFFVGPFMLPLVLVNPGFSKKKKIIVSVAVITLAFLLIAVFLKSLKSLNNYYQFLQNEIY